VAPLADDPVAGVDAALVSHVHYDHLDLPSIGLLPRGTPIVVPAGAGRMLRRRGFREVVEVTEGDAIELHGVRVQAVHAEHVATRLPGGPRVPSLGYVLEGPPRIYFAGDTDIFDAMAGIGPGLDTALVPIAGWGARIPPGHLDPRRAAMALRLLRPRVAVPIHWGTYRPFYDRGADAQPPADFTRLAAELAPEVEVRVLQVGDRLALAGGEHI
jgi:L-ascorbate metabolism protein UlaG (beta-lactamase superfamily)